jgi:RNA polymerase sigma-70 factor (ECF subfamily)
MLGDPFEAEDLALETFYRLSQKHPNPDPEFNVGGWLFRVATNLGLHSIRSLKRREHYDQLAYKDILFSTPENSPGEILDKKEQNHLARTVLSKLNPRQSRLLVMRYSGRSYKDIAQALNLSPASIGPLLIRAERKFEECYRSLEKEDL